MTAAKLRLAMASMGKPDTKVGDLCTELGITRQTLYRHVSPTGERRPDGAKLLNSILGPGYLLVRLAGSTASVDAFEFGQGILVTRRPRRGTARGGTSALITASFLTSTRLGRHRGPARHPRKDHLACGSSCTTWP